MKLVAPDWLSRPFLHLFDLISSFCPQQQRGLSGSLDFNFLSRVVCAKRTWKSSAAAIKEIRKGEFLCLTRNSKALFVSKAKTLNGICTCKFLLWIHRLLFLWICFLVIGNYISTGDHNDYNTKYGKCRPILLCHVFDLCHSLA